MGVFRLIALVVAGTLWGAWLVFFLREKGALGDILARFERLGLIGECLSCVLGRRRVRSSRFALYRQGG